MQQRAVQSFGDERCEALKSLCERLKSLPEISAKQSIKLALQDVQFNVAQEVLYSMPGDDCAAFKVGDGYQLIAMEGMLPDFVAKDPRAAGWSSVMVNISDIAAMGGRPTAILNAYWHNDVEQSKELIFHIQRACNVFGVTFAGGHSSVQPDFTPNLAVAITGYAKKLLSCYHVKPGQRLFMLSDLTGSWHGDLPYWGCVQGKSPEQIRQQWNVPAELAERDLVVAAKDISNGGLLGTLIMMLELSGCGACVDLNALPKPEGADIFRWLRAFQSYGFLLTVETENVSDLIQFFNESHLSCAPIGSVTDNGKIILDAAGATHEFWDIKTQPLTYTGRDNASY